MMIPLALRPASVRIKIAYLADAFNNYDADVAPANTATRAIGWFSHPYFKMWENIGSFYTEQGWQDLSDLELLDLWNAAFRLGYAAKDGRNVSGPDIASTLVKWKKAGWYRYEHCRNGRHQVAWKFAIPAASVAVVCLTGTWINPRGV